MSNFPNQIDTDVELPRIEDGITEITGQVINDIRDAVIAVEQTLGTNLQGNTNSLSERINVSIDANGNILASALALSGLVTLPITNSQIANNAGIQESKLNLNFPTTVLNNNINTVSAGLNSLLVAETQLNTNFLLHTSGTSLEQALAFNHYGNDILLNTSLPQLTATTVGQALTQIDGYLLNGLGVFPAHINTSLPASVKHQASEISVNTSTFTIIDSTANTVQLALDSIDEEQGAFGKIHIKDFHDNGIFRTITSGTNYNPNILKLSTTINVSAYTNIVDLGYIADSYGIIEGDILTFNNYTYQIIEVGPSTITSGPNLTNTQIQVYGLFSTTATVDGYVYASSTESSNYAPLATSIRNNTPMLIDSISLLNPNSAQVVSVGFNPAIFYQDGYDLAIEVGMDDGYTRSAIIPNLNRYRSSIGQANPITSKTVAERINAYLNDPANQLHFPVSAFGVGNEIALAHNLVGPQYTIKIIDGYTANYGLGFDAYGSNVAGKTIVGNSAKDYYVVNGEKLSTISTVFDGYGISNGTNITLYTNSGQQINPLNYGLNTGDIIHITNHTTTNANGSYTIYSITSSYVSTFSADLVPFGTFDVLFTNSNISLTNNISSPSISSLFQLFINSFGEIETQQRLSYSPTNLYNVTIKNITSQFPAGSHILSITTSGTSTVIFSLISNSVAGTSFSFTNGFTGSFKLFHYNNTEYIEIEIIGPVVFSATNTSLFAYSIVNTDEVLQLDTIHYAGSSLVVDTLQDTRLFGNIGPEHIRDDFINLYTQAPISDLRSDGVINGFSVLPLPEIDAVSGMLAFPLQGGVAYVQGSRIVVPSQKVIIPANITSATGIIGINQYGTIQFYNQPLSTILGDGYSQVLGFGRILPLYQVTISGGSITNITDIRLFISQLDNKFDIIVNQGNNNIGNFQDLLGALTYLSAYPNKEKLLVKILSNLYIGESLTIPNGVSLEGNSLFGGNANSLISTSNASSNPFIILTGNNIIKNLNINANTSFNNSLVGIDGYNVLVENCYLNFTRTVNNSSNIIGVYINKPVSNIIIRNNLIDNVYSGIVSNSTGQFSIYDNKITNVFGLGGSSPSTGIYITSGDSGNIFNTADTNILIDSNAIYVPYIDGYTADIRGINFNISNNVNSLYVTNNRIINATTTSLGNGIKIENTNNSNLIHNLFVYDNFIDGVAYPAGDIYGIYVDYTSQAKVERNTLSNIGNSTINSGNWGGIYVGQNTQIVDVKNNIIKDGYALYGIYSEAVQNNIIENDINNLNSLATYINITNNSSNALISNNNISGSSMVTGLSLSGTLYNVNGNNIINNTNNSTTFVSLINISKSIFSNNSFTGNYTYGVSSSGSLTTTSIVDNYFDTINSFTQNFNLPSATYCFVSNNRLPELSPSTADNIPYGNNNSIGTNKNLLDTKAISIFSGISANSGTTPYWALELTSNSWTCVSTSAVNKNLYFNLNQLNNGAKLVSAKVAGSVTGTINIYKQLNSSPYTQTIIGTYSPAGSFSQTITVSDGGNPSVIDYSTYTYYLTVIDNSTSGTDTFNAISINYKH